MSARWNRGGRLSMSSLFIFLLVGLFAVFSLLAVIIGVGVYRGVVEDADQAEQVRTSLSYIANKVRAADQVSIIPWEGTDALLLSEEIEGFPYESRIYYLPNVYSEGGWIYEYFAYEGDAEEGQRGDPIVAVGDFRMALQGDLLEVVVTTTTGDEVPLHLRLRAVNP